MNMKTMNINMNMKINLKNFSTHEVNIDIIDFELHITHLFWKIIIS